MTKKPARLIRRLFCAASRIGSIETLLCVVRHITIKAYQ
jgi:hypothetical protein